MTYLVEPPDFAIEWCRRLGANLNSLESLKGGINNKVFGCNVGEKRFVLKGFAAHQVGKHDRYKAEIDFLNYARIVAPEFTPHLLDSDEESRSLVLESLEGERFKEGVHPAEEDIDRAVIFMRRLNADIDLAKQYVNGGASEGFIKLTEHLLNIEQHLNKMGLDHLSINLRVKAEGLIRSVRQKLSYLQESTAFLIANGKCEDVLEPSTLVVSPSDFGFHNAIRTRAGVKFFDFEFAGWDDPTKAVVDFDLQPKVPLKLRAGVLSKAFPGWSECLENRYKVLLPILELKWACIILAVLNPDRMAQMAALNDEHASERFIEVRLNLAKLYINKD